VPKLRDQPLWDPAKPAMWIRDRNSTPAGEAVPAFIELFSGDRLPGVVVGFQREDSSAVEQEFAHWIVRPASALRPPRPVQTPEIRVLGKYVRRVVWQRRRQDRYQPGTLFYRDGKSFTFRTAKISDGYVILLLPDGPRRVAFAEIAELHLSGDFWEQYLDELSVLCPEPQTRLLQLETADGLIATASQRYFAPYAFDNAKASDGWVHGVQPAWSLDVLWVPHEQILVHRLFAAHEVPLSRLPPAAEPRPAAHPSSWPWQANRNTRGGPLRSGGQDYGWGFGVHAFSELRFPLPPWAKTFRTSVGLDRVVESGGCVQARVFLAATPAAPLFQTPVLVGSDTAVPSGVLALPPASGQPRILVLQVDTAHATRPPGADPFDIRDTTDWLDPLLELEADKIQAEMRSRLPRQVSAWREWTVAGAASLQWFLKQREPSDRPGTFARLLTGQKEPLSLSRQLRLGQETDWLLLAVSQERTRDKAPLVQVHLNGELALEQAVPFRENERVDVKPLVLPLADYRHQRPGDVRIELRQTVPAEETPVEWRGIALAERLPMLREAFEDQGKFTLVEGNAQVPATLVEEDRHSGRAAVKLASGGQYRLPLVEPVAVRERPGWGEFRSMRFAFRKSGGGRACLELDHAQMALRPTRIDMGQGDPSYGKAQRAFSGALPDQWMVITRDLYADFGPLDITGLILSAPDGQAVLFDHIYFARSTDDFQLLPGAPAPELTNQKARETLAQPILDRAAPAIVALDFGDGRVGAGTIIHAAGEVLTAGHLVLGPDKPVTAHLADGRELAARTRGVHRELDVGLVQLPAPGPFPFVELDTVRDLATNELYLGLAYPRTFARGTPVARSVVGLRRSFRDSVWTDFDLPDWAAGGPLLNRSGKVVAVHTRRSGFGGFLYSNIQTPATYLGRLKNGEVWGLWQAGTGPVLGAVVISTAEGCRVTEVLPGLSAATQGVQVGDYLRKVTGQPVLTLEDAHRLLGDKMPGQDLDAEFARGQEVRAVRLQLGPRNP
jgi:S1-C subfamily serine protease